MGAGSPAGSDSEASASALGIVQGHAYAILAVKPADNYRLIQLRNPWGRKEWQGDFGDKSDKWTNRLKGLVQYKDLDDGTFWMEFNDFVLHFEDIYVCRFFEEPQWYSIAPIQGEWKGKTAGGCTNFDTCKTSPQYFLTINKQTSIVITLAQKDVRGTDEKLKAIAIEVYDNKGFKIERRRIGEMIASNPESYIFRREVALETILQPSPTPYTVLLSTFNPNEETTYTIKVYSTAPINSGNFKEVV